MHWNYRILGRNTAQGPFYEIHSVYYDESGEPCGASADPETVGGESIEDLSISIDRLKEAISKPILDTDDLKSEFIPELNPET